MNDQGKARWRSRRWRPGGRPGGAVPAPGSRLPSVGQFAAVYGRPFETFERWRSRYGPRFVARIPGMPPLVFLAAWEDADASSARRPSSCRGEGGRAIEPIVGPRSFVLADEEEHLRGRMMLRESFRRATAERQAGLVQELAEREVASWPVGGPLPLYPRLRALSPTGVLRTIFGDARELPQLTELLRGCSRRREPGARRPADPPLPPFRGVWHRFLATAPPDACSSA